jgi:16S rRNA (cytidine1402-2'-O)-methyltransferase
MTGKIIFIGVDLGNLEDITIRALNALRDNKVFIVEHRRSFVYKLNLLKILDKKEIYEWPGESEETITKIILDNINKGLDVVYCSMEGMPCTTDPGAAITRIALNNNIKYTVFPGPSISSTMPILSGFCCGHFVYAPILPKDDCDRLIYLKKLYENKVPFVSIYPSREAEEIKDFSFKFVKEVISIFSKESMITLAFNLTYSNESIITMPAEYVESALNDIDFRDIEVLSVLVVPVHAIGNCA